MEKRTIDQEDAEAGVEPPPKRARLDSEPAPAPPGASTVGEEATPAALSFSFESEKGLFHSLLPSLGVRASTEPEVGITEYVDPLLPPFEGIIKHRFTDFLVFEVGLDNKVVRLRSTANPRPPPAPAAANALPAPAPAEGDLWSSKVEEELRPLVGERIAELEAFVKAGPPVVENRKFVETKTFRSGPVVDKALRGTFHKSLRELFGGKLVSETKELEGGDQVIDVHWKSPGGKKERISKVEKANQHPPYIHFTLLKTNREMHDALSALSRALHLQSRDVGSAGTKDKRAITVQRVSVKRGGKSLEDIWRAANGAGGAKGKKPKGNFRDSGVRLGDFEYRDKPLDLGMLKGNKFVVTLRDVKSNDPSTIPLAIASLSTKGFINYYGMQRFGTAPIPTHAVGLALLRGEWSRATGLLLCAREGEGEDAAFARQLWRDGKVQDAWRNMPRRCVAERAILEHFQRHDVGDHLSALSKIPKNLRMMYVHAWQSYIFNQVVSERVRLFGAEKPVVGDLVLVDGSASALAILEDEVVEEVGEAKVESLDPDLDDDTPTISAPTSRTFTPASAAQHSRIAKARPLTQADIDADTHSIFDVVLPLPGYAVIYPEGQLGASYRRIMLEDGIDPDDLFRKQKEYSLGGTYRPLLHLPSDVSHKLLLYTSPTQDLAQSDEDILNSVPLSPALPYDPSTGPVPEGHNLALQLELTLGAGTFATMALREVLKSRTGAAHQKILTEQMEGKFKGDGGVRGVESLDQLTAT